MSLDINTTLIAQQASQGGFDGASQVIKTTKNEEKIEAAAKEFEAMFVAEMMKPMFEGLKTDGPFGGGKGEEVFRGLLIEEYGKMMADSGQLNIAASVKQQMIEIQEIAARGGRIIDESAFEQTSTPEGVTSSDPTNF